MQEVVLAAFLVSVSVVFWRGVAVPFDLVKATIGIVIGSLLVGPACKFAVRNRGSWEVRAVFAAFAALIISGVASNYFWISLFGQYQRHTGLLFTAICLFVVLATIGIANEFKALIFPLIRTCSFVFVFYSLIQRWNMDPFEWTTSSFGSPIFGTIGNPNTASAFLGIVIPFLLYEHWNAKGRFHEITSLILLISAMSALGSFRSASAILALLPSGIWVASRSLETLKIRELLSAIWCMIAFFGYFRPESAETFLFISLAGGLVGIPLLGNTKLKTKTSVKGSTKIFVGIASLAVVLSGLAFRSEIASEFNSGMEERKYFYGAAWRGFLEKPIFGYGWETFGNYFPGLRSAEAAATYDTSLTSSVHSYPLSILFSGGIVMLVLIAPLVLLLLRRSVQAMFAGDSNQSVFGVALLAFFCQSVVNVEHPSIFALAAVLAGLCLSNSVYRVTRARGKVGLANFALVMGPMVLASSLAIRPLVADVNHFRLLVEAGSQARIDKAVNYSKTAYRLLPQEPTYSLAFSEVSYIAGDCAPAVAAALEASEDSNFNLLIVPSVATIAFNCGERDEALEVIRNSLQRNPFSQSLATSVNSLVTEMLPLLPLEERDLWRNLTSQP